MFSRLNLLLCALAFMVLIACGGSKSRGASTYDDDDEGGGGGGGGGGRAAAPPKANELKDALNEANSLTEENHKMAREIFELKNKLGLSTDE